MGRRWGTIAILALVVGWAPVALMLLAFALQLISGARSLASLTSAPTQALWWAAPLLAGLLMRTSVTSVALTPPETQASVFTALGAAIAALPALFPLWLLGELPLLTARLLTATYAAPTPLGSAQLTLTLLSWALAVVLTFSFAVFAPVVLSERAGLLEALGGAWRLMDGSRWKLLALYLLVQAMIAASAYIARLGVMVAWPAALPWPQANLLELILRVLVGGAVGQLPAAALQALWAVLIAVAYLELRRLHDGLGPGQVAEVFA